MDTLKNNWPRTVYVVLGGLLALTTAVATGAVAVPPGLHDVAPYAALAEIFLAAVVPNAFDQGKPKTVVLPPAPPPAPPPRG